LKLDWNTIQYCDCMDPYIGLPSIPDQSIDYCLTDIPFNVNISQKCLTSKGFPTISNKSVLYKDNRKDYESWCQQWFKELKRICSIILIYCGSLNLSMWCRIEKPYSIIYRYAKNSMANGNATYQLTIYPIVIYGKPKNRLKKDCFEYISYNGFLRRYDTIHPCPLNMDFWKDLIIQLQPESVIDPFLGSGTTALVCKKLGIPWIGYEMNESYRIDIEKRLRGCNKELTQVNLLQYLK